MRSYLGEYIAWMERQSGIKVKRNKANNAEKFLYLRKTLRKRGISLTTFSAYSPKSNGLTESMNRHLCTESNQ